MKIGRLNSEDKTLNCGELGRPLPVIPPPICGNEINEELYYGFQAKLSFSSLLLLIDKTNPTRPQTPNHKLYGVINHVLSDAFVSQFIDFTGCIHRFRYAITEFLLENKINKHAVSHSGITPMAIAVEHLNPAMVKILIKYGYNMNKACTFIMCFCLRQQITKTPSA